MASIDGNLGHDNHYMYKRGIKENIIASVMYMQTEREFLDWILFVLFIGHKQY